MPPAQKSSALKERSRTVRVVAGCAGLQGPETAKQKGVPRRERQGKRTGDMKDIMNNSTTGAARRRGASGDPLGPNSEIGRKLKQYYDELVSDEVPDRFAQLLAKLEQTEPASGKG